MVPAALAARALPVLAVGALLVPAAGCTGVGCTDVGASSQVRVDLPPDLVGRGVLVAELCAAGSCEEQTRLRQPAAVEDLSLDYVRQVVAEQDDAELVVELRTRSGQVLASGRTPVTFREEYPNGPSCGDLDVIEAGPVRLTASGR